MEKIIATITALFAGGFGLKKLWAGLKLLNKLKKAKGLIKEFKEARKEVMDIPPLAEELFKLCKRAKDEKLKEQATMEKIVEVGYKLGKEFDEARKESQDIVDIFKDIFE